MDEASEPGRLADTLEPGRLVGTSANSRSERHNAASRARETKGRVEVRLAPMMDGLVQLLVLAEEEASTGVQEARPSALSPAALGVLLLAPPRAR